MKFLERRSFLLNLSALVLAPRNLLAAPARIALKGAMTEGGLVIGRTEPGASVMLDGKMEDDASVKQCRVMIELADQLAARDPELAELYATITTED